VSALSELGPFMEPVGYFEDISLFASDIENEAWLSNIKYLEVDETAVTEENMTFASVVKVVCTSDDYIYFGSGTNVDRSGYILTNYHVVEGMSYDACMVGFPDPVTGLIREAYWTTIITDEENETGHDLAYLVVESPVFDDKGNLYGYYEKISDGTFPYFDYRNEQCSDEGIQLGSELLVLGYPPLSGGSLTITNGLVSSLFSQDNYIITSAKIVSGNSGGLAVSSNGCYVGVPTASYFEEKDEQLGEIIDAEFVFEFDKAIQDNLEEYYKLDGRADAADSLNEVIVEEFYSPPENPAPVEITQKQIEDNKCVAAYDGSWIWSGEVDEFGEGFCICKHVFDEGKQSLCNFDAVCTTEFGVNSEWDGGISNDAEPFCGCSPGYEWSNLGDFCVKSGTQAPVNDTTELSLSPTVNSVNINSSVYLDVLLSAMSENVNAAEATITFNPNKLRVVDIDYSNSLFKLWSLSPTYNNQTGIISFGGGTRTPYFGASASLIKIEFEAIEEGFSNVSFTSASVLASDGLATEVSVQTYESRVTVN
jgi:hypothetical protein